MKFYLSSLDHMVKESHPARGAWIEIVILSNSCEKMQSHPARGAWIEIHCKRLENRGFKSHPARGAWIEIATSTDISALMAVAPRKGCVD